jgi:hypothetical protein
MPGHVQHPGRFDVPPPPLMPRRHKRSPVLKQCEEQSGPCWPPLCLRPRSRRELPAPRCLVDFQDVPDHRAALRRDAPRGGAGRQERHAHPDLPGGFRVKGEGIEGRPSIRARGDSPVAASPVQARPLQCNKRGAVLFGRAPRLRRPSQLAAVRASLVPCQLNLVLLHVKSPSTQPPPARTSHPQPPHPQLQQRALLPLLARTVALQVGRLLPAFGLRPNTSAGDGGGRTRGRPPHILGGAA